MKRALVAGGAGFVGSHLCDALLADGWEVWAVDNFSTGRLDNVAHLQDEPRFHLVKADITRELPDLIPRVDRIFHLASPASPNSKSPRSYMQLPLQTAMANTIGTNILLERAKRDGARLLFASTSEIYGDPAVHPQAELYRGNVSTIGPRAVYDETKRFGETLCSAYWRTFGVDTRIIRIFNTYGERMDPADGRVIVNFATQALRGEALTIYGDGRQTRSFCYVTDLVSGILSVMDGANLAGEVFNLGNTEERTIAEFAQLVQDACGTSLPVVYLSRPVDDPTRRCPDISKATSRLGWQPRICLREGLIRTMPYFRDEINSCSEIADVVMLSRETISISDGLLVSQRAD